MASAPFDDDPPRVGRRLSLRAGLAALVIVAATGAAVAAIVLLQLASIVPGGPSLGAAGTKRPEPGQPQTIMILGTDERQGADESASGDARSDTIILARLDGNGQAIALMSIPRDFKVDFPGVGTDKINAAFARGGARATARTVSRLLSTPDERFDINHVVQVSFSGFRELVDYLGCAWIDVDRHYFNDVGGPGGYATIDIPAGYQRLCGADALAYVRYRHTDNDIIRGARQQDFVRQLLRQPGVQNRLGLGNARSLARLAGKYTRTDKGLEQTKGVLALLKLGLAVKDKPVVQVPFADGQLADETPYLTAPRAAVAASAGRFLHPRVATPGSPGPTRAKRAASRSRKRSPVSRWQTTPGLQDATAAGRTEAIAQQRKLGFPFAFPRRIPAGATIVGGGPRRYAIRTGGDVERAYRTVLDVGGAAGLGEYLGVQGTSWRHPPILDGPRETVTVDGRRLEVFYDGRRVRLVAWRTRSGVYWIANTLTRTEPYARMVAIARSLTALR